MEIDAALQSTTNSVPILRELGRRSQGKDYLNVDEETKKRIEDFFEGFELVEFLQISVTEIIERFEEEVEEHLDDIEELIGVRERKGYEEE